MFKSEATATYRILRKIQYHFRLHRLYRHHSLAYRAVASLRRRCTWRVKLPRSDSLVNSIDLQQLELSIGKALAEADRMGLSMVAIHLCTALEVLQREHPALFASERTDPSH